MAIDISGLQELVGSYPTLLGKYVYQKSVLETFKTFTGALPGAAYSFRIYEPGTNLQECCTTPDTDSKVIERIARVICLQQRAEYCEMDLAKLIENNAFRFAAGYENAGSVWEVILEQHLAALAKAVDVLAFQGDTDSADPNLNKLDGLVKLAETEGITVDTSAATSIYEVMQQLLLEFPLEAFDMGDINIYVGREIARLLQINMSNLDLRNYPLKSKNSKESKTIDLTNFPGTKIIPTRGLDGTNKVIATPENNIWWLTNLKDEYSTIHADYSTYHEKYFWYVKFLIGLLYQMPEYVAITELPEAAKTLNPLGTINVRGTVTVDNTEDNPIPVNDINS